MEVHNIENENGSFPILIDKKMKLIKPVYVYIKEIFNDGKAFNTMKAYTKDLKVFWEFLTYNHLDFEEVAPADISSFRMFLLMDDPYNDLPILYNESKRSPATVNRILSTVHGFYVYWAEVRNFNNPILMKSMPSHFRPFKGLLHHIQKKNLDKSIFKVKTQVQPFNLLSYEQIKSIANAIDNKRDRLIWKILATTGARIQEVLNLTYSNLPIPSHENEMSVIKNVKSKGKNRDIIIPTDMLIELDEYIMEVRDYIDVEHEYVFVALSKKHYGKQLTYSACYQKFKNLKEIVGFDFNFHDLRHTFATDLLEAGHDSAIVKDIMGHKHISTTEKYVHVRKTHQKNALTAYWKLKGIDWEE
ncbi:site-specific integrase [Bacillaceae bacterium IKA-2]|nr:site-specific integrase [Bacillaceae bacterium IKA-2]